MNATPDIGNGGVSGVFGVFLVEVSVAGSLHSSGLKTTGTPQGRRRFIRPSAAALRHRHTRLSLASFDRSQLRATPNSSPSATSNIGDLPRQDSSASIERYPNVPPPCPEYYP